MSRLSGPFSRRRGRGTDAGQNAPQAPADPPAPGTVVAGPEDQPPAGESAPQRAGADEVVRWPPAPTPAESQPTATQMQPVPASQQTLVEGTPVVEPAQAEPEGTPVVEPARAQPEGRTAAELAAAAAATEGSDSSEPAATEGSDSAAPRAGGRRRGQARRRLRYLRRLREVQVRDLGGLVFDLHRFGRERPDLVAEKLHGLQATDAELRGLETVLDDRRPLRDLREVGIGGECPRCGALHASDASFCSTCGAALTALRGGQPQGAASPPGVTEPPAAAAPTAAAEPPATVLEPEPVPEPPAAAQEPTQPPAREPAQSPAQEPVSHAPEPDGIPAAATPAPPTDAVTTQLYPGDPLHVRVVDDRQQ